MPFAPVQSILRSGFKITFITSFHFVQSWPVREDFVMQQNLTGMLFLMHERPSLYLENLASKADELNIDEIFIYLFITILACP